MPATRAHNSRRSSARLRLQRPATPPPMRTNTGRSKSGCWTCRIRRKKCDQQHDEQDRCKTCARLRIPCAGWGNTRPTWCQDASQLADFKTTLKRKIALRRNALEDQSDSDLLSEDGDGSPAPYPDHDDHDLGLGSTSPALSWAEESATVGSQVLFHLSNPDMHSLLSARDASPVPTEPSSSCTGVSDTDAAALESQVCQQFALAVFHLAQRADLPPSLHSIVQRITELAQWKHERTIDRTLSCPELAKRGRLLEQDIQRDTPPSMEYAGFYFPEPDYRTPFLPLSLLPEPDEWLSTSILGGVQPFGNLAGATRDLNQRACLIFLHAVVSGLNPKVPEIEILVNGVQDLLNQVGSMLSPEQRLFASCVSSCLTREPYPAIYVHSLLDSVRDDELQRLGHRLINLSSSLYF